MRGVIHEAKLSAGDVLQRSLDSVDAAVIATPAETHAVLVKAAIERGCPVRCEKPLAETVRECLQMAAASEVSGKLLMVSQSRRYFRAVAAFQRQLAELGPC